MNKLKIIILAFATTTSMLAQAGDSFVPLQKGTRMASDDLLYNGAVLTARDAQDLAKFKGVDLSLLDPKDNGIWSTQKNALKDQDVIGVQNGTALIFSGSLLSNSGLYRFNASLPGTSKIYTIHLDKSLHTMLLRKNILRKLGYKIPAMKYLPKVSIQFPSVEERESFLKKYIPEATLGTSERWVKKVNELEVEVQDVAVTESSFNDFYNVSMGIPTQTINSRTLRSLLIPYSLLDLYESINQYSWVDGKVDNGAVVLPHFTANEFATTIEDAQWMLRKINLLSRDEIKEAVDQAFFPADVASVVTEKVIARRNSLNRLFAEKFQESPYDQKITIGETVKDGKILEKDYAGFASRFAYGDVESPFEQMKYYLYAKIQSNAIDNLINQFNAKLQAYDIGKTRTKFFQKQFQDGLDHFIKTGEIEPIGVETWHAPVLNGNLIFSRDIILGNYLGTDNLVQLADTFGASLDLGIYVGIEGLGNNLSASVKATTSIVRTFSHIKPVKNLKVSLKEPYKNMFVNILKKSLKDRFFSLSELKNSTISKDEKSKSVQAILKEINESLDTGESLIMTDRLMPSANVKLNFTTGLVGVGVGVGGSVTTVKRIHIYKKSPKVLQIYDDSGFVTDINMSFQLSEYIPILKINGKLDRGNYKVKSYMVNISSDLDENPNLYMNALGVYDVLKNKNFEVLDTQTPPVKLNAKFVDKTTSFSLLFWKMKSIKGKTYYELTAKDGVSGSYYSVNKDFLSGVNPEAFTKQVANYYLAEKTDGKISINEEGNVNPGDSFFGRSKTQTIRFEASVNEEKKLENKFLTLSDSKMGWSLTPKTLKKMMTDVNDKFQTTLFDVTQIDFEKLRLYKVGYHINLYDRGIVKLNTIRMPDLETIEVRYKAESGCDSADPDYRTSKCGDLEMVKYDLRKCLKSISDEDIASCNVDLVDSLFFYLKFNDFKQLIGDKNFYVYGTIDGFRQHSEILNDTVFSNTVGKIGSKEWNGPLDVVRDLLGLADGEFGGSWLRDTL